MQQTTTTRLDAALQHWLRALCSALVRSMGLINGVEAEPIDPTP